MKFPTRKYCWIFMLPLWTNWYWKLEQTHPTKCGDWLYVLVMSRTCFRVNPHSIVAWISRNSLLEAGAKSEGERSLFGKKNVWITIVSSYLVLFIFVYVLREMGSNREMELRWFQWRLWLMFCIILLCSLASRHQALYKSLVNFGVCTIQKNCACTK